MSALGPARSGAGGTSAPEHDAGFGAGEAEGAAGRLRAEVRAVNGRFLEVRSKVPPVLGALDAEIRKRVAESVHRGRVDLVLVWEPSEAARPPIRIDEDLARSYVSAASRLKSALGVPGEVGVVELLGLPGVVDAARTVDVGSDLRELVFAALDRAIGAFIAARGAEGGSTARAVGAHLASLGSLKERIASRAGTVPQAIQRRLEERLARLGVDPELDGARLAQEVAYLADRSDIAEELARIDGHIARCQEMLSRPDGAVGKALEFLAQELQREVNTIGSKCQDGEISGWVLEMKGEIERVREQSQNLE